MDLPAVPGIACLRIHTEDSVLSVDTDLLSRCCDYFPALLRSGMRECRRGEVQLHGVSVRHLRLVLDVAQGHRPSLAGEEMAEAVRCAAYLQARPLAAHLSRLVNSRNCLLLCHAAATHGLWEVLRQAALLARDMYHDLTEEARHLPLQLQQYITSLTGRSFVAMGTHSPSLELLQDSIRTVCYLDEEAGDWKHLTDLPVDASTAMAGVAVLANRLYVVGGVRDVRKQVVHASFCYDPWTDVWSSVSSPQQPRYNFTLVGLDGHLYAIGGEYERALMSSTEAYDVSSDTWSLVQHCPRPVAGAACAKAMGRIFVCFWKPSDTTDIYEYVPGRDEWLLVTSLIHQQSYGHCIVAHEDNLYVMRNGPSDDFLRCLMDCYNVTTGQWSAVPGLYVNSRGALFTAAVRGDSAFTVNRMLTLEYTVGQGRWRPRREMKGFPRSGSMRTCLLRLPHRRVREV